MTATAFSSPPLGPLPGGDSFCLPTLLKNSFGGYLCVFKITQRCPLCWRRTPAAVTKPHELAAWLQGIQICPPPLLDPARPKSQRQQGRRASEVSRRDSFRAASHLRCWLSVHLSWALLGWRPHLPVSAPAATCRPPRGPLSSHDASAWGSAHPSDLVLTTSAKTLFP